MAHSFTDLFGLNCTVLTLVKSTFFKNYSYAVLDSTVEYVDVRRMFLPPTDVLGTSAGLTVLSGMATAPLEEEKKHTAYLDCFYCTTAGTKGVRKTTGTLRMESDAGGYEEDYIYYNISRFEMRSI